MNKHRYITKHNKTEILRKANRLVNSGATLKRVLQCCRISYRQLLKLSRDPNWNFDMRYKAGYMPSQVWNARDYVNLKREVAKRMLRLGISIPQVGWMLGLSNRQVYRYRDKDSCS